jgi:DNA-binding transcriptional LysR family regulator
VRLGHTLDRQMIAVRVSADQRLVVVGSPGYFATRGRPTHPSQLHAHDCSDLRKITRGTVDRWSFIENGKELEIAVDGRVVTNDGAVLVDAALEGLGLAYVFESMVQELVAEKRLVRVLDSYCPQIPGYFLYYPSRAHLAPKLKALVEFLKDRDRRRGRTSGPAASPTRRRA